MFIQKFFKYTLITLFLPQSWFSINLGYLQDTSFLLNQGANFPLNPWLCEERAWHGHPSPMGSLTPTVNQCFWGRSRPVEASYVFFEGASWTSTRGSDKKCKKLCVHSFSMYVHVLMYNIIIMYIIYIYSCSQNNCNSRNKWNKDTQHLPDFTRKLFFPGCDFRYGANFTGWAKKQALHKRLKTEQGVPKSRPSTRAFKTELPGWITGTFLKPTKWSRLWF